MTRVQLFLLRGRVASSELVADAEHLKKIPKEKMADFIKWIVRFRVNREAYTDAQWEKFRAMFTFKSIEELNGAQRFASRLLEVGCEIDRSALMSDLEMLGFEQEKIGLIMNQLESVWDELDDYLRQIRPEAIPVLTSVRWRVDTRSASSNYLKKPEVVALLRIGTNDGTHIEQIFIELDKDDLSFLDAEIGRMKREFLKAEEKIEK